MNESMKSFKSRGRVLHNLQIVVMMRFGQQDECPWLMEVTRYNGRNVASQIRPTYLELFVHNLHKESFELSDHSIDYWMEPSSTRIQDRSQALKTEIPSKNEG